MNLSIWQRDILGQFHTCIIGGGIVGWSAALALKRQMPNASIAVIEQGSFLEGASTRNAGFACFGSLTELMEDAASMGEAQTLALVEQRWLGLQYLFNTLGGRTIDFARVGGFELFRASDKETYTACLEAMDRWNVALADIVAGGPIFSQGPNPQASWGWKDLPYMIQNRAEGSLHPGKMMQALQRKGQESGIDYFPGVNISHLEESDTQVNLWSNGEPLFTAARVLACTNGFSQDLFPQLAIAPARNLVMLTQPISDLPWQGTFHFHQGYVYMRRVGERVLIGGGRHLLPESETTTEVGYDPLIKNWLLNWLKVHILTDRPIKIEYEWSGVLGVGPTKSPLIEAVSPRIGVAIRLGGMGVAIGSLVGKGGADLILEELGQ